MKKLEKKQPQGKIYLILDNASYHHSGIVKNYTKRKRRIKLIFLPPYSPNLNPIERLWRLMHQRLTWNRYFATYHDFRQQTLRFFSNVQNYRTELDSLITDNFQLLPVQQLQTWVCWVYISNNAFLMCAINIYKCIIRRFTINDIYQNQSIVYYHLKFG